MSVINICLALDWVCVDAINWMGVACDYHSIHISGMLTVDL